MSTEASEALTNKGHDFWSCVAFWERECTVAALAALPVCPLYRMPCWVCTVLHVFTGEVRSVTGGRFERFKTHNVWTVDSGMWTEWLANPSAHHCPHHPDATGHGYWRTAAASVTGVPDAVFSSLFP